MPEGLSKWTIHCLSHEKKKIIFIRQSDNSDGVVPDDVEEDGHVETVADDNNQPSTSTQSSSHPEPVSISPIKPSSSTTEPAPVQTSSQPPPSSAPPPPCSRPELSSSPSSRPPPSASSSRPSYSLLSQCGVHKQKYNVFAAVSQVLELPRKRKSKFVARLLITDESLGVDGDLRTCFKFDILTDLMSQMPEFQVRILASDWLTHYALL